MLFIGNKNHSNRSGIGSEKLPKSGVKSGPKYAILKLKNHLFVQKTIVLTNNIHFYVLFSKFTLFILNLLIILIILKSLSKETKFCGAISINMAHLYMKYLLKEILHLIYNYSPKIHLSQ